MSQAIESTSEAPSSKTGSHAIPVSIGAMLVTLGVVYGDIGTSPMYVTKALLAGQGGIMTVTEEFILGALSLVIWTVTLLTTVKYVLISLKADNHGEGGIFALYSIVRKYGKWLIIPALLGGAALLAAGIAREHLVLDPGFGFAKTTEQNYELLAGLHRLCALGYPVLAGLSRKSMIYRVLGVTPAQSLAGTVALGWECLRQGAAILRVHDVREAVDTVRIFNAYVQNSGEICQMKK